VQRDRRLMAAFGLVAVVVACLKSAGWWQNGGGPRLPARTDTEPATDRFGQSGPMRPAGARWSGSDVSPFSSTQVSCAFVHRVVRRRFHRPWAIRATSSAVRCRTDTNGPGRNRYLPPLMNSKNYVESRIV
jgi:hypothetical protein